VDSMSRAAPVRERWLFRSLTVATREFLPLSLDLQFDARQAGIGGDVKHVAVFAAKGAVRGGHAGIDAAQVLSLGREDVHSSRAGGEQVAVLINLHAVGKAILGFRNPGSGVKEDLA